MQTEEIILLVIFSLIFGTIPFLWGMGVVYKKLNPKKYWTQEELKQVEKEAQKFADLTNWKAN